MGNEFRLVRRNKCPFCHVSREAMTQIQKVVNEQAEDEGLWSVPAEGLQPIAEAYLQQELRRLHAVIEESAQDSDS